MKKAKNREATIVKRIKREEIEKYIVEGEERAQERVNIYTCHVQGQENARERERENTREMLKTERVKDSVHNRVFKVVG